jgi:hypothetical protein
MSALTIGTDVPTNINSLEKMILWAALTGNNIASAVEVVEVVGELPQSVAQVTISQAADDTYRASVRLSVKLDPAFMNDRTKKLWEFAQEWSSASIPAAFKAN